MIALSGRRARTLTEVFERPTRADVRWDRIESLVVALGGELAQGRGSRVRMRLAGVTAVFHRPHPGSVAGKATVEQVRRFLETGGIHP
ncbi:MAG: type II toxin-antitoxin system HicA family toxin [Longimicrobiales bacterium]